MHKAKQRKLFLVTAASFFPAFKNAFCVQVLLDKGVEEGKILFLSLIAAPEGVHKICGHYPKVKVITTEIDEGIAPDFQVIPGNVKLDITLAAACKQSCLLFNVTKSTILLAGVGEFGDRYFCD